MRFRSDATVQQTGFALTVRVLHACQRNYTALAGRIAVGTLATCDTHITLPANYTIALYFTRFYLYLHDHTFNCSQTSTPLQVSWTA